MWQEWGNCGYNNNEKTLGREIMIFIGNYCLIRNKLVTIF